MSLHLRHISGASAALIVGAIVAVGVAGPASADTITAYDSIPSSYSGAETSLGFGVTSTAELGQHVELAGSSRTVETVSVGFTSWACESGIWNDGCQSTAGGSFDLPITLNVHAALPDSDVDGTLPGELLATVTKVVAVPFRPSADPVACEGSAGWFFDTAAGECVPGVFFVESFDLSSLDVVLPDSVIVSVAFDAEADPGHSDALNVSLQTDGPTVGTEPDPDNLFWNTTNASYYTDGGAGGVGILRSDSGWGESGLMVIAIDVTAPVVPAPATPAAPVLAATGSDVLGSVGIAAALLLLGAAAIGMGLRRRAGAEHH
ncbi:hypothetical protein HDC94_002608 [Leifsonia sp. AK011]|uniref:hypothetical protein n=1 Tax=Leifsonia sp. AK011 TaxID=2723075 RepID=UPI0015CE2C09|nr:hypothetical protein [Leifsonia sp. AK011]NYF11452.1 hypothetical protein [Leifsonia sp. AK011]